MKRIFDFVLSLGALLALLPLLLLLAAAVKLSSPGPVFFLQERVGRGGRRFRLCKFRTMVADAAQQGPSVTREGDARVTRVGALLRRWKLDELPQLWNVVKGDMSLVGPRPELPQYVALFPREYERVLSVRPGITDLATLHYRDEERLLRQAQDLEQFYVEKVLPVKLRLNLEYLEKRGFWFDVRLILLTLARIVRPSKAGPRP
jgi:lipopolysaccharide/colanic/teichoic acid biosynthesis glycosyltransferase